MQEAEVEVAAMAPLSSHCRSALGATRLSRMIREGIMTPDLIDAEVRRRSRNPVHRSGSGCKPALILEEAIS
jgi:hypothetical protein